MAEFVPFRFQVSLFAEEGGNQQDPICRGAFSEVTGFEASMSVKTLKEGGRNWGEVQLAGATSFPAIVLKRGITDVLDLYKWFDATTRGANYAYRMTGIIDVYDQSFTDNFEAKPRLSWRLTRALATKFKSADLSSTSSQVAIEELHLMHEGLALMTEATSNE